MTSALVHFAQLKPPPPPALQQLLATSSSLEPAAPTAFIGDSSHHPPPPRRDVSPPSSSLGGAVAGSTAAAAIHHAAWDTIRAELLRQKIVFDVELRRQRDVYDEQFAVVSQALLEREQECVHLRSSIASLSQRVDALERGGMASRRPSPLRSVIGDVDSVAALSALPSIGTLTPRSGTPHVGGSGAGAAVGPSSRPLSFAHAGGSSSSLSVPPQRIIRPQLSAGGGRPHHEAPPYRSNGSTQRGRSPIPLTAHHPSGNAPPSGQHSPRPTAKQRSNRNVNNNREQRSRQSCYSENP